MATRLRISAHIIRWPQACACCFGQANTAHDATSTRVRGKRVVRVNTRSWRVPYCSDCLEHVEADNYAKSITTALADFVLVLGLLAGLGVAFVGSCCCGTLSIPTPRPGNPNQNAEPGKLVAFVAGSIVTGSSLAVGAYFWSRSLSKESKRKRRKAERRADSLCGAGCCDRGIAVVYDGWYGSVHDFWFASDKYAEAFSLANPGKMLSG